jgi:hypothetical protein
MKKTFVGFVVMLSLLAGGMYGQEVEDPVLKLIRSSYGEPNAYSIVGRKNFERIQADPSNHERLLGADMSLSSKTPLSSTSIQRITYDAVVNLASVAEDFVQSEVGKIRNTGYSDGDYVESAISHETASIVVKQMLRDIRSEYEIRLTITNNGITSYAAIFRFSCAKPSTEEIVKIVERVSYAQPNTPFIGEFVSNPGGNVADFADGFTLGFADDKATTEDEEFFWVSGNVGTESSVPPAVPEAYTTETYAELLKRAKDLYTFNKQIFDADETYQQMLKRGRRVVFGE